jgi:hypothetical protein
VNAFIIGAGFTKAVVPHSPPNDDLLKELAGKKPDSEARALGELYDENRIEVALTKFDCDNIHARPAFAKRSKRRSVNISAHLPFSLPKSFWMGNHGLRLSSIKRSRKTMLP